MILDKLVNIKLTYQFYYLEYFRITPSLQFNVMLVNIFCSVQIILRKVFVFFFNPSPLSKQVSLS